MHKPNKMRMNDIWALIHAPPGERPGRLYSMFLLQVCIKWLNTDSWIKNWKHETNLSSPLILLIPVLTTGLIQKRLLTNTNVTVPWNVPLPWVWPRSPRRWASCSAGSSSAACHSSWPAALDTWTPAEFSGPPWKHRRGQLVQSDFTAFSIRAQTELHTWSISYPFCFMGSSNLNIVASFTTALYACGEVEKSQFKNI